MGDGVMGWVMDQSGRSKKDCNSVIPHLEMVFFEILTHTHTHCLVDQAWQC
jgi:hypothetical protein